MAVYKFVLHQDYQIQTNLKGRSFKNDWLEIFPSGLFKVTAGYAWNGNSPKFTIKHLIFGTNDGAVYPGTGYAYCYHSSMVHDVLYQFKSEVPISRKEADILYKTILEATGFYWVGLYYSVIRLAGWIFGKWKTHTSYPVFKYKALAADDFIAESGGYTIRVEQMDFNHWWYSVTLKSYLPEYSDTYPADESLPILSLHYTNIYTPYDDGVAPKSLEEAKAAAEAVVYNHFEENL